MKTAEEWSYEEQRKHLIEDWSDESFEEFIKKVQLDAYKQGMTDAAEVVRERYHKDVEYDYGKYRRCDCGLCQDVAITANNIESNRDNLKELS
jgi:hypothetical protein